MAAPANVEGPIPISGHWAVRVFPIVSWRAVAPTLTKITDLVTPFPIKGSSKNV